MSSAASSTSASPPRGVIAALLWDVDGTLAETELEGHRRAFNRAFAEEGLPWRWDRSTYLELLAISGGRERMHAFLQDREGTAPAPERLDRLQSRKQHHYGALVRSGAVALRPGVTRLIQEAAAAGLPQAIVTTSGRSAVQALMQGSGLEQSRAFSFWICGEDVARKKPDPEAYQLATDRLGLDPARILAIEDTRHGLRAARQAGLRCLITLSASSRQEAGSDGHSGFEEAEAVLDSLGAPKQPLRVHRGPTCPGGLVTLTWLQRLLAER